MGSVDQASGAYFLVSEPSGILVYESHVFSHKYESDAAKHALPERSRGTAISPEQAGH
jgi:hypothetical protein